MHIGNYNQFKFYRRRGSYLAEHEIVLRENCAEAGEIASPFRVTFSVRIIVENAWP